MLGGWRRLTEEEPKTQKPFACVEGERGMLSRTKGYWEFFIWRDATRIGIPAALFKNLLFMDDFRGKSR